MKIICMRFLTINLYNATYFNYNTKQYKYQKTFYKITYFFVTKNRNTNINYDYDLIEKLKNYK